MWVGSNQKNRLLHFCERSGSDFEQKKKKKKKKNPEFFRSYHFYCTVMVMLSDYEGLNKKFFLAFMYLHFIESVAYCS